MRRAVLWAGLALVAFGCSESGDQNTFVVRVTSINMGAPLSADVIVVDKTTGQQSVPEDAVVTEFTNKVYATNVITDPSTFAYDFQLKSYRVHWRRADGGPISGTGWQLADFDFTGATAAVVPVNGTASVGILLAPAGMKIVEPFVSLQTGGYIPLVADIDFVGSPAIDPSEDVHVQASLSVSFANFADKQ